jgi:hypothetical protein
VTSAFFVEVVHSTAVDLGKGRRGGSIMITLLVLATGVSITPLIRFMIAGFECLTVGVVVLRIMDAVRRPRLVDLAAQRRERWEAVHPVQTGDGAEEDDD